MMIYLLLIVGFIFLIKGADFFVDGASSIAGILKVPSIIIGLTIVAMGTSAPETAVSITAGLAGNSDISLGNIVGSNIFNQLIVIGVCAVIFPVATHKDILRRDLWWNIGISTMLFLIIFDHSISRVEGLFLFIGMIAYLIVIIRNAKNNRSTESDMTVMSLPKSILFMLLGLGAVILGGNLVVENASLFAKSIGMSDTLVGLTIVAIGTSLPELATSIVAARKGDSGIALGNAIGSCLFNIMFILGIASMLSPIHASAELLIDAGFLIAVCIIIAIFSNSKKRTTRIEGIFCIVSYLIYTVYIILR